MVAKPPGQLKLTDEATRTRALGRLKNHLNLQAVGYEYTTETVLDVLIRVATRLTIEAVCNDLAEVVDSETVRGCPNERIKIEEL